MSVVNRSLVVSLAAFASLAPALLSAQAASATVSTTAVSGAPGSAVQIPVTVATTQAPNGSSSIDSLSFAVKITANNGAPAFAGSLAFSSASGIPAPSAAVCFPNGNAAQCSGGANLISIGWVQSLKTAGSPISGTVSLGTINLTIPSGATNGQTYTVHITGGSASLGDNNGVPFVAGPDTNITAVVNSPPPPPPATPTLALNSTTFNFTSQQGGAEPATQSANITNTGGGTLSWSAAAQAANGGRWLSVSPASGVGTGSVTITADNTGLTAGTYSGTVTITAPGANSSPQMINVSFVIAAPATPPAIALSSSALSFSAQQGNANPANQTVTVSNGGGGTLTWTAAVTSGSWLSITYVGSVITVSANISGLAPNTYTGAIQVSSSVASNGPVTIAVTLVVSAPPQAPSISLSPGAVSFSANQGGASPASKTVSLSNAGGGTLNWSAAAVGGSWLSVTPASGTGPATLTISAVTSGLAAGNYTGSIQVTATGAGNTPQTIAVSFIVVQGASSAIALTPMSLQFVTATGTSPAAQTFQVQNSFSSTLGFTATATTLSGGNWLSVSPSSGASPATVTVTVNSNGLAKGVYQGAVTIAALASSNAINSPQTVQIALAVSAPVIGQNGIVEGAGFATLVSSGGIESLFGQNLAMDTASATTLPLPKTLANTQVLVNNEPAPLFYVSPTQINFQMPAEPAGASVSVVVVSTNIVSLGETVNIAAAGPGIFTTNSSGSGQGAILNQDFSANSSTNPAPVGSVIQIFSSGLGLTNPSVPAGQAATSSPLSLTVAAPIVTVGGNNAVVGFSGLAPGFVGLYQVNVTVPAGTPSGANKLNN